MVNCALTIHLKVNALLHLKVTNINLTNTSIKDKNTFAEATMSYSFYKSLGSFIVTRVSQELYLSASHHKCNVVPGALLSEFISEISEHIMHYKWFELII